MVQNLFGDLALDTSIKFLKNIISRFTFDSGGSLRVGGTVSVPSTQTLAQVNVSIGDAGKSSTVQLTSAQCFYSTIGANFKRA